MTGLSRPHRRFVGTTHFSRGDVWHTVCTVWQLCNHKEYVSIVVRPADPYIIQTCLITTTLSTTYQDAAYYQNNNTLQSLAGSDCGHQAERRGLEVPFFATMQEVRVQIPTSIDGSQ